MPETLMENTVKKLVKFLDNDSGSATLEFIVLALPLFLPLFIFLSQINQTSNGQALVENFAKQAARAYATAPSEEIGLMRINQIKTVFESNNFQSISSDLNLNQNGSKTFNFSLDCESSPCLTPDKRITLSASFNSAANERFSASVTEIVDKWRNY